MRTTTALTSNKTNRFDLTSAALVAEASKLRVASTQALGRAHDEFDSADNRTRLAALNLLGAVANTAWASGYVAKGTAQGVVLGGGHAVAALGVGSAALAVQAGEESLSLGARVLNAAARGFVRLGNALTDVLGDGKTATVKEIEGNSAPRLSTRLYQSAERQWAQSGESFAAAWASYGQAMGHALGAQVNLGYVAAYGGLAMADLAQGLAAVPVAAAARAAAFASVVGALGVQAAEAGVAGARDLLLLGAQAAAGLGRAAAHPGNAASVNVTVEREQRCHTLALRELLRTHPEIAQLPAAQQFLRLCAAQP